MGLFDSLFGKKATPVQTSKTGYETLPDFGQTLLQDIVGQGRSLANLTTPFAPVPFTAPQQAAMGQIEAGVGLPSLGNFNFGQQANNAFGQAAAMGQTITPLINQGTAAVTGNEISQGISNFFNPYLQQVLDPTLRNIREQGAGTASDIRSLASEGGAFGGTRQAMLESELNKNLLQQVGDTTGQMYAQGFNAAAPLAMDTINQGRNRYLTGAGVASNSLANLTGLGNSLMGARMNMDTLRQNARNTQLSDLENIMKVGDLQRTQQQQTNQIPVQQLELLRQIFGTIPTGGGGGTLRANQGLLNSDAGGGAAGAILQVLGPMISASDINLKQDIKPIGEEFGHKLYEFAYKDNPGKKYIGVIAQDVEQYMPEAVLTGVDGFKYVDYSMLGFRMQEVA